MKKRINKSGIMYLCILLFCIIVGVLAFLNENKEEKSKFTIWNNIDIEHQIYNEIKQGISYSQLLELVKKTELNSSLSGNVLKVRKISIDVSNKENLKIRERNICEAFKQIDIQKDSKNNSEIIYKASNKSHDTYILKYKNGSYYLRNQKLILLLVLSFASLLFLIILFWMHKNDLYDKKIDNNFYSYDHYNKYYHFQNNE